MIKRALLSVSNKDGIVELARELRELGVEIISTGGTAEALKSNGIDVVSISDVTNFPECFDGRVKTLHPKIHGGLLAVRDNKYHIEQMKSLGIEPIDMVVLNLYPFRETITGGGSHEEIIENIDIGGPAMLRSAAKNYRDVAIVVDPMDYLDIIKEIKEMGSLAENTKLRLAGKAFRHVAHYDALIAQYFTKLEKNQFPEVYTMSYVKAQDLRYGENPHQKAAFYKEDIPTPLSLTSAKQLHGKELSFNNINDGAAAIELLMEFNIPAAVAIKHANPCGVATGEDIHQAFLMAYQCDTVSIFGGIVAFNREVDERTAKELSKIFLEIVIAPSYSNEALEILTLKKDIRILKMEDILSNKTENIYDIKKVRGGILLQEEDNIKEDNNSWTVATQCKPTGEAMDDLAFAWKVAKHVKSNAIVVVKNGATIGIGPGQVSRIDSAIKALNQGGVKSQGAVLASEAFIPFEDTVELAAKHGITAIVQPGGSKGDNQVIASANKHNIAMVFTGVRHFKH